METNLDFLSSLEQQFNNIGQIREQLIRPKKIQLHTGIEGFNSPDSFGIYRHTGGHALGVVGSRYEPQDLELFLDSVTHSLMDCGQNYDLSKLKYKEYKDGQKVSFEIPSNEFQIQSPVKGDVFQTKIQFFTGFDGLTKTSITFSVLRLWCENGAKSWQNELNLSFKNTKGNVGKTGLFCEEIAKINTQIGTYRDLLQLAANRKVSQAEIDNFMFKICGVSQKTYNESNGKARAIFDRINASTLIETNELGNTAYALLQGITRYTTHTLSHGNLDDIQFDNAANVNKKAHEALLQLVSAN